MAIRSNVGNQVTNAMQILSVGATTAARTIGSADKSLNNMTKDERKMVKEADKQRRLDAARQYLAGGSSPYQHMTDEEQSTYQQERAKGMKAFKYKGSEEDEDVNVDDIVTGGEEKPPEVPTEEEDTSETDIVSGSSQAEEINYNIHQNLSWAERRERLLNRIKERDLLLGGR